MNKDFSVLINNNNKNYSSFSANPEATLLPDCVPIQPMPFHNQILQHQPVNILYRMPFNNFERTSQNNQNTFSNNHFDQFYYPDYNTNNWSYTSYDNTDKPNHDPQRYASLQCETPRIESTELQATAQEFVPRLIDDTSKCEENPENDKYPESSNNSTEISIQKHGTRPKEFVKYWQKNKENKAYEYDTQTTARGGRYSNRGTMRYSNNRYFDTSNGYMHHQNKKHTRPSDESNFNSKNYRQTPFEKNPNYYAQNQDWRKFKEGSSNNYGSGWSRHQYNNYNTPRGNKRYFGNNAVTRKQKEGNDTKYGKSYNKNKNNNFKDKLGANILSTETNFETASFTGSCNEIENVKDYENANEDNGLEKNDENVTCERKIDVYKNEKMQRETLIENLTKGIYECMVCCDRIKQTHAIWSCCKCYNCFHLGCIKKWAGTSSQGEPGWRCPACQNQNLKIPVGYFCFCKKLREPEWNRREIPHSCGEVCGKKRENEWCVHKCNILCHPGPCPDCTAFINRHCQCGKESREIRCSQTESFLCGNVCGKLLNCGVHTCEKLCHVDSCEDCSIVLEKECFCGKETRKETCSKENASSAAFSCGAVCGKTLSCGHHNCNDVCHEGKCKSCERTVESVTTCPCGKKSLEQLIANNRIVKRTTCLDPIPTCGNVCGKVLKCGTPGNYHTCKAKCHEGDCPQCSGKTAVKCRCGFMNKNIPCSELLTKADEVICEKQCKKLRQCGRHKCGVKCCIDIDHICSRVCGKTLKCRQHKCQEPCHRGNCPRCWETSFEELSCHCGGSVLYPPIPCGTEPPSCELPCQREQACSHPVSHNCHAEPKCPPCTTLLGKPCFGKHTIMKSTPCYVAAMSCGEQCAKKLPCGVHLCQKVCHDGPCIKGPCKQKCTEPRPTCDHPCGNPCHSGPCPNTPCKEMVTVTCLCGNRKTEMICSENEKEYKSMATSKIASELHCLNSGGSVNISQIFSKSNKAEKFKRLECNDECGLIARNRQLALALQITNPDAREFIKDGGTNLYTDSVKDEARKDIQFTQTVHSALNDLVLKAKESKQKSRSHSFAPMNRDKRRFIHEYSKYFGCQSQSYDEEPKKNVVVTAFKNMCRLPPISIISVIQKEQGQRKGPGPVLNRKTVPGESNGCQLKRLEKSSSLEKKESPPKEQNVIDYFDFS